MTHNPISPKALEAAVTATWTRNGRRDTGSNFESIDPEYRAWLLNEARLNLEGASPYIVRAERMSILASHGIPDWDAESALDAYERTHEGEPCGADAIRVASILRATK